MLLIAGAEKLFEEGEEVLEVGVVGDPAPCVVLRLTDDEYTRELWPHAFELYYKVGASAVGVGSDHLVRASYDARWGNRAVMSSPLPSCAPVHDVADCLSQEDGVANRP